MKDGTPLPTVLIFGGTAGDRAALGHALDSGFDCLLADTPQNVRAVMTDHFVQIAICADLSGEMINAVADWPETVLIVVCDDATPLDLDTDLNVQILPRDWSAAQLKNTVETAGHLFRLRRENERMSLEMRCLTTRRPEPRATDSALGFEGILRAPGSPMASVVSAARQYASFDVPILLVGEAGTGKADLARAIHDSSLRSDQPFQTLDVTGLSDEAVALALFGQRKPANGTPAAHKTGLIRKADHGTLYLCGIETLSHALQMRLLRLARDGLFEINGAPDREVSHARLITATLSDPQQLIGTGQWDPALYYALSIAELAMPPLKARKSDIPLLARAIVEEASRLHGKLVHGFSDTALEFLMSYSWPGNLRELENEITRMLIQAQEPLLGPEVISRRILQSSPADIDTSQTEIMTAEGPLKDRVEAIEARILRETLTRLKWNKSRSAAELGLSRVGLRAKLDLYGITQPQTEEA